MNQEKVAVARVLVVDDEALIRWSLGEQGRTLRTRRAEDLIFAGSSVRRAQGMADVTLVIDNEDADPGDVLSPADLPPVTSLL